MKILYQYGAVILVLAEFAIVLFMNLSGRW